MSGAFAGLAQTPAAAGSSTIVSLTFDDGTASHYGLAWQRALAPHGVGGTFYVPSGRVGSGSGYVTWDQLATMSANGSEIGGHTINHVNLTGSGLTYEQKLREVCDDRETLAAHGLSPVSFAYPEAAYDQTAKDIVRTCGYASGRTAGGVSASGPTYAETLPPQDAYATRTWVAPTSSSTPIALADMQAEVRAAADHGGGWVQLVFHRVCSQTYDSANYSNCINSWRPVELNTLNAFLDWMAAAGQTGGAPAGAAVRTVRDALGNPQSSAPSTQMSCNGGPCSTSWYSSTVQVTLTASSGPAGSPVTATHYTTDGSTPTRASTVYTGPFSVTSTSSVAFFSVDQSGAEETVKTQSVRIDRASPTVSLTNPANDSSFRRGAKIQLAASAEDAETGTGSASGIAKVAFYLDGTTRLATITASPYQYRWNSSSAAKGRHTLTAVATDVAGNSATSPSVAITLR
jgi:peptidoglycan/xylan/chitin deacetylase (PgdA/CDA1 family)